MKQDSTMRYVKQQIWKQRIGYGVSDFACNLIWQMISLYLHGCHVPECQIHRLYVCCHAIYRRRDGFTDWLLH